MSILDVCRKRWRFLTVAAAGTAAVCLLRSEVERKTLSVEEFHIFSPKIRGKGGHWFFSRISMTTVLDLEMRTCLRPSKRPAPTESS